MCDKDKVDKLAVLFEEAVELANPEERTAFLARACAGDNSLRQEVEHLLWAHERAGGFLSTEGRHEASGPGEQCKETTPSLKPGDRLGCYHLVGMIGEGGSSTVFLAEQEEPVRRWVALKVLKAGMDTRQIIARFKVERQALALMDHPGIAKVLDAGETPTGRPFFVMELVHGLEITRHCDEHRLGLYDRLELFIQVCQAVLHAHQKGIVHRDIKPDNILVCGHDARPVPKVIDFGIAKVLHGWAFGGTPGTSSMPFMGTPAYMSPEQAEVTTVDLDTRTDIYSLGALLHELLVGHPPFDHTVLMEAGLDEMRRIIRFQESPGPSSRFRQLKAPEQQAIAYMRNTTPDELRRDLRGDLDWIVLKAIEKERDRRYESAAHLAQDVERHLKNLPVSAAAPTLTYRVSKLVRRNRKAVAMSLAVTVLLLVSAVATVRMAVHATRSARTARALQLAATDAERQSQGALVAMHISSGFAAFAEGSQDRAVLWFANAARVAGPGQPEYALNTRRAVSWLERTPIPTGAFQLPAEVSTLEFCPHSRYLLAVDRSGNCQGWDCAEHSLLKWLNKIGPVQAAAWHPNGGMLALGIAGKPVQIRDPQDGRILMEVPASAESSALGFTEDGRYLVFGRNTVRVLDLRTQSLLDTGWEHPDQLVGFGYSGVSNCVVSAARDGHARLISFSGPGNSEPLSLPHRNSIRTDSCASKTSYREEFLKTPALSLPALAAGGTVLATRTGPFEVSLWRTSDSSLLGRFADLCCSCRFIISPDGSLIACGLQESRVGLWETATGRPRGVLASLGACILDVAFGPAGESLLIGEANGTAKLWSIPEGKRLFSTMHHSVEVDKVAFRPDGRMIATAQADGLVRVWSLPRPHNNRQVVPAEYSPKVVRLDPQSCHFVASKEPGWQAEIRKACIYAVGSGKPIGPPLELDGHLEDAVLSPDCRQVALALHQMEETPKGVLEFRDPLSGRTLGKVSLPGIPASLAWDPRGGRVAAICRSGELVLAGPGSEETFVWAQNLTSAREHLNPSVAFARDGNTLVSLTASGDLEVREAASGLLRYPLLHAPHEGFWHFALSEDSRWLGSTTSEGEVQVWDLKTGNQSGGTLYHPGWVYRCRFNPKGTQLVTACHDGKARIWDLRTGEVTGTALAHPNEVYDATFTPDGRWILTACRDGSVRMWDPFSGRLVAAPVAVGDQTFTVEVTADGEHAVVGSLGDDIHVLSLALLRRQVECKIDDLCLLAEVVSGSTVAAGAVRDLTTAEWIDRFRRLSQIQCTFISSTLAERCGGVAAPGSSLSGDALPPATVSGQCTSETCTSDCPIKATPSGK